MGFGGAAYMIAVIKYNRNLLGNRKPFDKDRLGGYGYQEKPEFNCPESSPHILRGIKEKMKEENRRRRLKIYFVFAFVMVSLVALFIKYH